jgi:hypothetical protein
MKTLILISLLSSVSFADSSDFIRAYMKKGECVDSRIIAIRFDYDIAKKLDKHHYEMIGLTNGVQLHAILETSKASFNEQGKPAGIKISYQGVEEHEMTNGFTAKVDRWKECEK